jgi:predicted DNA binding CopG/RHH family protein
MKKKRSESSAHGTHAERRAKHISDSPIDFSDIPEASDEEPKRMCRVGRPSTGMAKQLIAIRLSPKLLSLRRMPAKLGRPYQALIHELLEKAAFRPAMRC